jgi:hypothetical protein
MYVCVCGGGCPPCTGEPHVGEGHSEWPNFRAKALLYYVYGVCANFFLRKNRRGVPTMLLLQKNKRQEFLGSTKKKRTITIANELMTSIWIGFDSILILLCVEAISILACAQILELTIHIVASKSKND